MENGQTSLGRLLADKQVATATDKNAEWRSPASDLLLIDGIANSEALAALGTTTAQDCTAPTIFHTGHETLLVDALTIVRLECSFHCLNLCKKAIFFGIQI